MNSALVPIDSIKIGERVRGAEGNDDIIESAKGFMGQVQSIAVCELDPIEPPYKYLLLAGCRRLDAFRKAGLTEVLVRIYPATLSEIERKSIELVENLARMDFTWQEKTRLTKQIHDLQTEIHGKQLHKKVEGGWNQQKTAELIGVSTARVSRDLELASAFDMFPELADCKTQRDAENLLAREKEKLIIKEKARRAEKILRDATEGVDALRARLAQSYIIGECVSKLKDLPSNTFHLVELDPPYGIAFTETRNVYEQTEADNLLKRDFVDVSIEDYPSLMRDVLTESYRLLRPSGWCIVWFAMSTFSETVKACQEAGFDVSMIPCIWKKQKTSNTCSPSRYLHSMYEPFLYCRKGDAQINKRGHADVFCHDVAGTTRIHPTEKPISLMRDIYSTFTLPMSNILIPFAGSGNGIIAAYEEGMSAIAFDLSETFRDAYIARIAAYTPKV